MVCDTKSLNAFNPYTDTCPLFDLDGAAESRKRMLQRIASSAAASEVDALWIGRDLGYRGGRRTGLALTDDYHVAAHLRRWNVSDGPLPLSGDLVKERTATAVWELLDQIACPVFLWNVFPLHPHDPDDLLSNRAHTSREKLAGEMLLAELVDLLRPARLVAIGRDAATSARRVAGRLQVFEVRHPSYGGLREFQAGIAELYEIAEAQAGLAF